MTVGILTEKPSAMRNFAKALGGTSGTFNGEKFVLTSARGHLYGFPDPHLMVPKGYADRYKKWDVSALPWDDDLFNWKRVPISGTRDTISAIKKVLSTCDEIVIATDVDPSGEGELIAWEVLDALKLHGKKISRMFFVDEAPASLQKAFKERKSIRSMNDDDDYRKADFRCKFDLLTMQFTRIASSFSPFGVTLRQGRLKSAMVVLVGDQFKALEEYKPIPFYSNRFKDENGIVYTDPEAQTYKTKAEVPQNLHDSDVVLDSKKMCRTSPPKLLDLASLSSILASKGINAKTVLATYQKMYEDQVVSYPRTEDKTITPQQFNELSPKVDKIADLVGANKSLLTHRAPRKTHVKEGGAHGANRPGPNVPSSLDSLSKYGTGAKEIYTILAKSYLTMLAEDYQYEQQKGHVKDYPSYVGTANIPKVMGFKAIFDDSDDVDVDENKKGLGQHAKPFVHEGVPPRPATPTMKWLIKQLEKRDVGTGATRTSTYADVTNAATKCPLMKDKKGVISMTPYGNMSYQLLPNTRIGDLALTEYVYSEMREIAKGNKTTADALKIVAQWVQDDIIQMTKNAKKLDGSKIEGLVLVDNNDRVSTVFEGEDVSFKRTWSGHYFTDDELESLLNGDIISFEATSAKGNTYTATGKLGFGEYEGRKFFGFQLDRSAFSSSSSSSDREECEFEGQKLSFKKKWSDHEFTDKEIADLKAGKTISFEAKSKAGKPYTAKGKLGFGEFNGKKFFGFQLDFGN